MDWESMPLELFSSIAMWLDPREVAQLECICKPWKENLSSQLIWQVK